MSKRRTRSENAGIAAVLRYLLVRHEYQEDRDYARDAGVSPSQVSRYTSGKVSPWASTRERLVLPVGVTVPQLDLFSVIVEVAYEELVIRDHGEASGVLSLLQAAPESGDVRLDVIEGALPPTEEERTELVRYVHFLQQKRR